MSMGSAREILVTLLEGSGSVSFLSFPPEEIFGETLAQCASRIISTAA